MDGVLGLMMLGLCVGILHFHMPMLIPLLIFFQAIVFASNTSPGMHTGAAIGGTFGIGLLLVLAWYWYRALEPIGIEVGSEGNARQWAVGVGGD